MGAVQNGAAILELKHRSGQRARVHICTYEGQPKGLAHTALFDLILMDVRMPGMDGLEVTRRIRQMSKSQTRSTPVMALTANALREEQAECLRAGMDGYVSKPIQRSAFFAEMDRLLTPDWRLANRDDLSGAA